jgi:nitroreductase
MAPRWVVRHDPAVTLDGRASMASVVDRARLSMPVGEAMFGQRAIRRFRPDPIPVETLHLLLEAAVRAPNGGNRQTGRFLAVTDRARLREFGALYREAWWAKRFDEHGWTRPEDVPAGDRNYQSAMRLADAIGGVPCVVFALTVPPGGANSIIPAAQNLMLAARALGIGSVPTTLHPKVMDRFHAMFGIPGDVGFHFCIPLGYPEGEFRPSVRRPTAETCYLDRWGAPVPWA